ncbi:MAG TPA: LysR family transcriptional regulator [Candidatus Flavonifractor intestinipullorum]|uniref:LysR family transcriptional regulator n=1 Tax=Candidatus Flavonifractor intestinipullorum TaxID=2838587 RepID=A0A9D2MAT9_9FIRM|nr:LysR family transcriptional regulator [Candidatus Flavonifractor intestinipullorum]
MEIRVLNYFLLVAREENITRAASLLHLTQPTLSRQLMQLEEELGVKLFHRSKHHIILTEDGMLLRRRAEEIVALADKTKDDLRHREEQLSGTVAVGSGELHSSHFLAQLLTSFQKENPLVRFAIYSGNSDNIKERIERGLLDVGLLQEPVDISKYRFVRLPSREQWGVLIREDAELASKERVSPADLASIPLILPEREIVQNELLNWFGPYAERLRVTATGNLLYNLASLARDGGGGVLTLNLDCSYEGLRFIPLAPAMESNTVLVWKKTQTFSAAAAALIAFAKKYISGIE